MLMKHGFTSCSTARVILRDALSIATFENQTHTEVYLFWGVLTSLLTLYRSYYMGQFYGQRKPVHTVGPGSVRVPTFHIAFSV